MPEFFAGMSFMTASQPRRSLVDGDLVADARTVATVAPYFQELQIAAGLLSQSSTARTRGYFQPSEEEQLRHLLISYWQARCALLEVVQTLHQRIERAETQQNAIFLIGFAGAMVLIDGARFLRDQFHTQHVIRQKLNEAEPSFGIPEGIYDTVQESLTRPLHVWHLYHAWEYWKQHRAQLTAIAAEEPLLGEMLAIIERLESRLDISTQRYATARLRVRTRQVWTSIHRDMLFRAMYGLQKLAGDLVAKIYVRPWHQPGLPPAIVAQLRGFLAPGDVIVSRREFALTNYFLPGHWPHAALYLGGIEDLESRGLSRHAHVQPRWPRLIACDIQEPKRVLEAMKDGVLIRSLRSPCSTDSVVVLRPQLSPAKIDEALARGIFHEGKPYDFGFDFTRADRLVCTEVVYRAYDGVDGMTFQLSRRAGRMTLSAGDLLGMALARQRFEVAACYARETAEDLLVEQAAEALVRKVVTAKN